MKAAKLLHNPGAGEGGLGKKELKEMIETAGYTCSYSSTKEKGWEKIGAKNDFVVIAGGDGTVRKVAAEMLTKNHLEKKHPIGLLPLGTANNIATTLGLVGLKLQDIILTWKNHNVMSFDVGLIEGIKDQRFFIEGFGFGVFPKLMDEMKKREIEKTIENALTVLHEIILSLKAVACTAEIDGVEHVGNYLLVEVMNTRSIGPNLNLAPQADPSDGELDVVLVPESEREEFAAYIYNKMRDQETPSFFHSVKAKKVNLVCDGLDAHVDDVYLKLKDSSTVKIELADGTLKFLAGPTQKDGLKPVVAT